jgi:hypothetical protein
MQCHPGEDSIRLPLEQGCSVATSDRVCDAPTENGKLINHLRIPAQKCAQQA